MLPFFLHIILYSPVLTSISSSSPPPPFQQPEPHRKSTASSADPSSLPSSAAKPPPSPLESIAQILYGSMWPPMWSRRGDCPTWLDSNSSTIISLALAQQYPILGFNYTRHLLSSSAGRPTGKDPYHPLNAFVSQFQQWRAVIWTVKNNRAADVGGGGQQDTSFDQILFQTTGNHSPAPLTERTLKRWTNHYASSRSADHHRIVLLDSCHNDSIIVLYPLADETRILGILMPLHKLNISQCEDSSIQELRGTHNCPTFGQCKWKEWDGSEGTDGSYCCCKTDLHICAFNLSQQHCSPHAYYQPQLRKILLSINAICATISFSLIFLVLTQRKIQEYGSRGWALMEILLLGAVLIYSIVVLDFFPPEPLKCCLKLWFRELGFVMFYSSVILKIYRNLMEYRVRKAQSVHVREKELMKYLLVGLVLAGTGLVGWTVGGSQASHPKPPFLYTQHHPPYKTLCRIEYWAIIWHLYEAAFLMYGLWLCYKARNTNWIERWQFAIVVFLELVVSISVNFARYILWYENSWESSVLLNFVQSQLTMTVNIVLIIGPKIYFLHKPEALEQGGGGMGGMGGGGFVTCVGAEGHRAHPSLARLRDNIVNGAVDFGQLPISEMHQDDIRAELKRVYTQLRMFKLKNAYQENPHISKRKSKPNRYSSGKYANTKRNSGKIKNPKHKKGDICDEEVSMGMVTTQGSQGDGTDLVTNNDGTIVSSPHNLRLLSSTSPTTNYTLHPNHSVRV